MKAYLMILFILFYLKINGQSVYFFDSLNQIGHIHESSFFFNRSRTSTLSKYPLRGNYAPIPYTMYNGSEKGVGEGNYIYFKIKDILKVGIEYRIKLKLLVDDGFLYSDFVSTNFGIALTQELFSKDYGLWPHSFNNLKVESKNDGIINIETNFRSLCLPNYLVLGVFDNYQVDNQPCWHCNYKFQLFSLEIQEVEQTNNSFEYFCDDPVLSYSKHQRFLDTVFFEIGSSEIKDKDVSSLHNNIIKYPINSIIRIEGYADNSGTDNYNLVNARIASVVKELVKRGVDTTRIIKVNYGDSKSTFWDNMLDRKVEIKITGEKLYQKYYTHAQNAIRKDKYPQANELIHSWLKMVPPDKAIFALFDDWGDGQKATFFKSKLKSIILIKHYKDSSLKFSLDSLWCEDQKSRTLEMYMNGNYLFDAKTGQNFELDSTHQKDLEDKAIEVLNKFGIPDFKTFGLRGSQAIPYIIIHSVNDTLQEKYLTIFWEAAGAKKITYEMYALLYDKLSVRKTGKQRYGTQYMVDETNTILGPYPYENPMMIKEYRRRVGLAPLSDN